MMGLTDFSSIFISLTAVALPLALALAIFVARKRRKYHPVAGTVLQLLVNFHRFHDFLTELAGKHKTYRMLGFFNSQIYTTDPANIEYVLKTNFANYGKGWWHYNILKDLLGDGIFTVDGEKWQQQRKISSYEFSTRILRDFSSGVFKNNAVKLAHMVSKAAASNQSIEIQSLFTKATLDSVFKILLGVELDAMCGTYEEGTRFTDAFDTACSMILYRYVDILWKIKRFLNIGSEAVFRKNIKVVDDFVYKLIQSKIEQLHNSHDDDDSQKKKEDILSRFLQLEESDPKFLRDIILCFVLAGKDTTAVALSWFLYMLCKHPDIQEKIAMEVIEATQVSDHSSIDEIAANITEGTIDKMQYLHAALTETLRIYPAAPVDGKLCFSDDILPDGFSVKKGDQISFAIYAMGRMKHLWGNDAEEFRPERWINENGIFEQASSFKFTSFLAGPRICLGKEFAYRQMKIFSMILLGSFRFKLCDDMKRVNYKTMITLNIEGGLHLHAFPRMSHVIPVAS